MLTEKQIKDAREEEFMNEEQLSYMKNLLMKKRRDIVRQESQQEALVPALNASDPLDRAQAEAQWMVTVKMRALQTDLLNEVDQALIRVENGDYGYCELSGEPIDIRRLLAQPACSISAEEKSRQEVIHCNRDLA